MQIRIFTDESHAVRAHRLHYLIHPVRAFWGDGTLEWETYKKSFSFYKKIFQIEENIDDADICVLPMTWNYYVEYRKLDQARSLAQKALDANRKLFIWVDGDRGIRKPFPNAVVLQFAAFRSKKSAHQLIRPGDANDLVKLFFQGVPPIRSKGAIPKVGFCGQASSSRVALIGLRNLSTQIAYSTHLTPYEPICPILPHILLREEILNKLSQSPYIEDKFIVRGKSTVRGSQNAKWREEFVANMHDTDYTVCIRGTANYSIRFYETLAMGRIPIFIDTDCALPFHNTIDWKSYCVWIDRSELSAIDERVIDFHQSISDDEFQELQYACRQLWLERLSPEGFYGHFQEYVDIVASLK